MSKITEDPRIDPRIKATFGAFDMPAQENATSREELVAQANSEKAIAALQTSVEGPHDRAER